MKKNRTLVYRKIVHSVHKLKVKFVRMLNHVDKIPAVFRLPVGVFLLGFGAVAFYIPFINGFILMIIGARMMWKRTYVTVTNFFSKKYPNLKTALFHNLKD